MLTREFIYTGVTRARTRMTLVCDERRDVPHAFGRRECHLLFSVPVEHDDADIPVEELDDVIVARDAEGPSEWRRSMPIPSVRRRDGEGVSCPEVLAIRDGGLVLGRSHNVVPVNCGGLVPEVRSSARAIRPARLDQRTARAHRLGQTGGVSVTMSTLRITIAALACMLGGCCDRQSGEVFGTIVLVAIYGAIIAFAAAIVAPIFYFIGREFRKHHRSQAARMAWFPAALRGRTATTPGTPASVSFQPSAGLPCSIWMHLDFEAFPATYRLDIAVTQGAETLARHGFDGYDDGEDFSGPPPHDGLLGFSTPDDVHIRRALTFTPMRADPISVSLCVAPTGGTRIRSGQFLVLAGEPPS